MLLFSLPRLAAKKKVFELFCRDQLLVNFSLRVLTPAERRSVFSKSFKELSEEALADLNQRAAIEESRLAAQQRAAAAFRPVTPYEFFVQEQKDNPALGTSASPRDREVRLLQIYETLPEKAREALAARAESYNTSHSKAPQAPSLPVVVIRKKKMAAKPKKKKQSAKKKKKKTTSAKASSTATDTGAADDAATTTKKGKGKKTVKPRGPPSPYAMFVKEQMASLHNLAPKERMRVIGERWRSLTNEERERRLEAGRVKIAADVAAAAATAVEPAAVASTPAAETAAPAAGVSSKESAPSSAPTVPLPSQSSAQGASKETHPTPATPPS